MHCPFLPYFSSATGLGMQNRDPRHLNEQTKFDTLPSVTVIHAAHQIMSAGAEYLAVEKAFFFPISIRQWSGFN
jgi:hypothetical protein